MRTMNTPLPPHPLQPDENQQEGSRLQASPKTRTHFIPGNELNLPIVQRSEARFNLIPPRLLSIRIYFAVKTVEERIRQRRASFRRQFHCFIQEFSSVTRHGNSLLPALAVQRFLQLVDGAVQVLVCTALFIDLADGMHYRRVMLAAELTPDLRQ